MICGRAFDVEVDICFDEVDHDGYDFDWTHNKSNQSIAESDGLVVLICNYCCEMVLHVVADDVWNQTVVVVAQADEPEKIVEKPESKTVMHLNTFERAWWKGEAELQDGKPYVSRSVLKEMLLQDGRTKRTVENDLCPSYENTIIGYLINAEIIKPHLHGWIMINDFYAGSLILKKEK